MTRFRLIVEYDGGPFMGWQRQAHGPSVQQAIEEAVEALTGERAVLHAAGRTDAGVHALAMAAHVDVAKRITAFRLAEGLNAKLRPLPVAILSAEAVPDDWHARFSCVGRRYLYHILNRRARPALEAGRAWHVAVPLDAGAMDEAARALVGRHDFTTFRSAHCQSDSPVKTLDRLAVRRCGDLIEVEAAARSFLHHQVRSMVGCLQLVGRGKWSAADLKAALDARDRAALGLNAPPEGLYFVEAQYPPLALGESGRPPPLSQRERGRG
ncbi:MAG TPA: tRNA pseudouridine(38-40) synthase TruA [Allosphingosinicella sp.]